MTMTPERYIQLREISKAENYVRGEYPPAHLAEVLDEIERLRGDDPEFVFQMGDEPSIEFKWNHVNARSGYPDLDLDKMERERDLYERGHCDVISEFEIKDMEWKSGIGWIKMRLSQLKTVDEFRAERKVEREAAKKSGIICPTCKANELKWTGSLGPYTDVMCNATCACGWHGLI